MSYNNGRIFRSFSLVSAFAALVSSKGIAGNSDLNLTVSGTLLPMPQWQDSLGNPIQNLGFVFSGIAGVANANVDSAAVSAKLESALSYPATVNVTLPTSCAIGSTKVVDADVAVLMAGTSAQASITLGSNKIENFALRFKSSGSYGDKSGVVSCVNAGRLRYSY